MSKYGAKDWERLYRDLERVIATMPPLDSYNLQASDHLWLARAYALVDEVNTGTDSMNFASKVTQLQRPEIPLSRQGASEIRAMVYRALATTELKVPASVAGSFIASGAPFDAFVALAKVFKSATKDVLLVDAYMDEAALTDFAVSVPDGVTLRLLADQKLHKATLEPAAGLWVKQYGTTRPLQLRLAAPLALHDRAIFIDGAEVWLLSQSLNGIVKRSPATISRAEPVIASDKIPAYEAIWVASHIVI